MTRDEIHEALLLRAAVEASEDGKVSIWRRPRDGRWFAAGIARQSGGRLGSPQKEESRETLTKALADLLTDLGTEVPTWPSDEAVRDAARSVLDVSETAFMRERLRALFAREPLTVLALLTGPGES